MTDSTCARCGALVQRRRNAGPVSKYCGKECKRLTTLDRDRASTRYAADRAAKRADTATRNAGKTCAMCAATFDARTARTLYCSKQCAGTANRAQEVLRSQCSEPGCDRGVRAKGLCGTHYNRTHCTPEQRHRKVTVPCDWCGDPCVKDKGRDHRYGALFCSLECRDARRYDVASSRPCPIPESHPAHPRWVGRLLPVLYVAPSPAPVAAPTGSGIRWVAGTCHLCGTPYVAEDYSGKARFCSIRCARRVSKDRYRARKTDAYVADVWRTRVYERDGWRCQLCRKKVDRTKVAPHPRSPVLDHVLPLACGGKHEPANVQCAHYLCNSLKSDGVFGSGEQLLLIG
jgi:endogenous inhibitor of DNA gyrase (YacG/DUF329 family)